MKALLAKQIMLEKEMYLNRIICLIIVFNCFTNNVSASIKDNILNKFKNIENISFNFEQNINGKIENGNCIIKYPKKFTANMILVIKKF